MILSPACFVMNHGRLSLIFLRKASELIASIFGAWPCLMPSTISWIAMQRLLDEEPVYLKRRESFSCMRSWALCSMVMLLPLHGMAVMMEARMSCKPPSPIKASMAASSMTKVGSRLVNMAALLCKSFWICSGSSRLISVRIVLQAFRARPQSWGKNCISYHSLCTQVQVQETL